MKKALVFLIACCASMVLLAQQPHWTPVDEGLYSGSTGIIAIVQIDGVEQTSTQMELAAFCGDECRGTAFTSEFPITHRYLAMLNVYGENGHELTFKAYDHATNQELLDMNPVVTVVFSEDGSGSLFEPLELNFVQEVVDENITFADANVKALCVANWDTNGDGELSYDEAAAVTDLGEVFKNNTTITSFDELQYFTGLTTICNSAFYCCFGLRSIEMPQSVISIDDYAFYRCQDLESLILPDSIQSIGNLAFYLCLKLTSLDIPNSLTYLGSNTFNSCYGLEQIIVAEDNTVFDSRNNCNAIIETVSNTLILGCQNTIIPNTVIRIGNSAFYYCVNLQSIEIPHSVTSIGEKAFAQCYGLTAIEIPNSVVSIDHGSYGDNVFGDCYLEQILVEEGNPVFDSRNNCNAIIETSTNKLIVGCQNTVIPNTVNTIGCSAFYCCWFLHSIEIPISVTSIEDYAFYRCQSLESLELPQLLTSIGRSAFYMCLNIDALEIPASVTSIGDYAFYYCTGLTSITSLVQNPPTLGNNVFLDVDKSISVYVPCVSMYTYQNVAGWDEFTNYTPSTVCNSGVISVSVNPIEGGTVTGGGYFEGGAVCTLTANANEGYLFVNWTKDGVEVSNSETYSFNVDGDATYVANYEQGVVIGSGTATNQHLPSYSYYKYSLSQQIYTAEEIGGGGSIGSVAFYNAGATKTRNYNVYMVHTDKQSFENNRDWVAVTESDLVFSGEVTMSANVWTRLQLDTPFQYDGVSHIALIVDDNSGNLTISPNMACSVFDAQGNQAIRIYSDGTNYDPFNPSGYYGTLHSVKNQIRLGIETNSTFSITTFSNPVEGGTITGSGTYTQGATCTLTATPAEGYTFVNWTEDGATVSTDATYSFEVTGARSLVANFAAQGPITNHWIPNQSFENTMDGIGIVLIDGVEQQSAALELGIFCGEECRGSVLPEEEDDHWFYYFSMGGVTNETFSFRLYDHALQQELELTCFNEVPFEINAFLGDWDEPYEFLFSNNVLVTVSVNPEGAGEVTGAGEYPYGTEATLSVTANPGFAFREWVVDGEVVSAEPTLVLTVENSINVIANFDYVQEYVFSTGWNWWSSYIELSDIDGLTMLEEGLGESGVMIKTNGSYARRRPNNTWFGSLNSINNETGYKIQTSSNCTVVVRGSLADPSDHPIAINASGWTWIGYPVQASQSANAALSGFNPENKDVIKGQNGYARYDVNSGTWKPSSFTLTPGKSYLYYSNATETKSLVWNAGRSTSSDPEHHWTPNQTFENTMDGIGIVVIDGEEQFTGDLELGIFCGDDCRGSVFAEDEGDHWFYYFSMGGVSGETFTFRLYNHATQEELDLICNNEAVPFEINGFLGDWDAPYEIDFTSNSTQTYNLSITGYGNSAGGYYLIAPPIDNVAPTSVAGMTEGDFDLYYFDQSQLQEEWRNYEAEPFNLTLGKGYLYAHKTDVTLSFSGTPYSGNGQVTLSKTNGVPLSGWNLVGNPFALTATIDRECYVMNSAGTEIIAGNTRTVNPMQGVFVIAAEEGETLTFIPENSTDEGSRIVVEVLQGNGVSKDAAPIDRAIVRFGDNNTLPKLMLNPENTKLYIPAEDADYAVTGHNVENATPVSFKASHNGTYTLSFDIVNLDLEYLHLIDNKTGDDIDLLDQKHTSTYTFEALTTDYAERFKLVYATANGVDEGDKPFAYYANGEIRLFEAEKGASLQMVDMTGHIVVSQSGRIQCVSTDGLTSGVYMLRLINGDDVKVQKIVVR